MANIYTNSKVDLTSTAETVVYTSPAAGTSTTATTSIIKSILVSEDSGNADSITLTLTDTSSNVFSLFKTKAISANATDRTTNTSSCYYRGRGYKSNSSIRK